MWCEPAVSLLVVLCVCSACCVRECVCFPNGSVAFSCGSMLPGHPPNTPSTQPSPYAVTASSATYQPGGVVTVTMETVDSSPFTGFLLQARSRGAQETDVWPVGTFTNINTTLFNCLNCSGIENSSVSQASATPKTRVQVIWMAPNNSDHEEVCFSATFVRDYKSFWVKVLSSPVRLHGAGNPAGCATVLHSLTGVCLTLLFLSASY